MAFYARCEQGQYFYDDAFTDILFALKKWNESDHKTQVMLKHPDMWIMQFLYDNKKDGGKIF